MTALADLYRQLEAAHAEALRVGDSPLRADNLADRLPVIARAVDRSELHEDIRKRVRDALSIAERVLRRDDDGREAARHLHIAIGLLGPRPSRPSPFAED